MVAAFYTDLEVVEDLLEVIGEEQITGFQLRDVLDETKDVAEVKAKIRVKINQNLVLAEYNDEDLDKDKTKKYPYSNIEALFKDLGFADLF